VDIDKVFFTEAFDQVKKILKLDEDDHRKAVVRR
jgi:hypothetical protein